VFQEGYPECSDVFCGRGEGEFFEGAFTGPLSGASHQSGRCGMSEQKTSLLLKHYLKKLKLPTILREYSAIAAACKKDKHDYASFLLRLVERESLDREKRAAERRVKNARFPVTKTLDTFDFKAQPSINEKWIRELIVGEYIDRKENVLLVGNSGTGKTHLASALGFAGCMQGRKVRFFAVNTLVTHLMEMTEQRQLERTVKQLEKQDLLILDELGYVPFSKTGAELLFEVISRAYERLSLIITTNLPFESWVDIFGCERLTGALLDRLTHRVHILEVNGPSYRLMESKKKRKHPCWQSDSTPDPMDEDQPTDSE
jgi:DNA replication protein DnaC